MPRGLKAISIPPDNRFNRPLMLRFAPSRKLGLAFITGGRCVVRIGVGRYRKRAR